MNKNTMIKNYRRFSGADKYIVGFDRKGKIYYALLDNIPPRFTFVHYTSKTHIPKLQMYIPAKEKDRMIKNGSAICLGDIAIMNNGVKGKGWAFEKVMYEYFGQEWKGKDNKKFSECGDITVDGLEIQFKWQNAQVVVEKTLHNLQEKARASKKLALAS